jgi:HlyD family secretion protein
MTGTEMMRIANFNSMEVQVEVSENDILRVELGDSVDIEVDAYLDETFKGIVTEIANSAANTGTGGQVVLTSDQVTNFIVKIRIDAYSYSHLVQGSRGIPFRPGMSASVDIYTNSAVDVPTVPIQAVTVRDLNADKKDEPGYEEDEREVVFVVEADTVRLAPVKTGIQDNEFIQITDGLSTEDTVVEGPYAAVSRKLEEGDAVSAKEDDKDKKKSED